MARNSGRSDGTRVARADRELRGRYRELHAAMSKWLDGGDFDAVDIALDGIARDDVYQVHAKVTADMPRDERVLVLSQQLTVAGQMVTRLRRELSAAIGLRRDLKDQLLVAIAEPRDVPNYVVTLWDKLRKVGAKQEDLQPQSVALAKVLLEAARAYNERRAQKDEEDAAEDLTPEPVTTWRKLDRTFSGFELVDVEDGQALDPEPCELPPSADIAYYTVGKSHPGVGGDRRTTYQHWAGIVMEWADRNGRTLTRQHARIWAMLLAHRMPVDSSAVQDLFSEELRSPWKKGGVVRIKRHIAREDDVPY